MLRQLIMIIQRRTLIDVEIQTSPLRMIKQNIRVDTEIILSFLSDIMPIPTVASVSAPEPAYRARLVVLAGERDSGDACRTFIFHQENHTLGNSLRHMLLMNPRVVFAGYTIPHPAEDQMHIRIQTVEEYPAQTALKTALQDLKSLALLSKQKFLDDVARYKKENPDCQKIEPSG